MIWISTIDHPYESSLLQQILMLPMHVDMGLCELIISVREDIEYANFLWG